MPERSLLASRLTPGAGLHSARVAWRHSLRFRLSLMYTLGALLITAIIGFGITAYLLGQMNRQFDTRLAERAEAVADRFTSGTQDIGKQLPANNIYTAVLTEDCTRPSRRAAAENEWPSATATKTSSCSRLQRTTYLLYR